MKRIEERIRVLIAERSMTLLQLAIRSEITEATLHAILNRNDAKYSQLKRIAEILGVSVAFLTSETDLPSPLIAQEPQVGYVTVKTEEVIDMQRKIINLQERLLKE